MRKYGKFALFETTDLLLFIFRLSPLCPPAKEHKPENKNFIEKAEYTNNISHRTVGEYSLLYIYTNQTRLGFLHSWQLEALRGERKICILISYKTEYKTTFLTGLWVNILCFIYIYVH